MKITAIRQISDILTDPHNASLIINPLNITTTKIKEYNGLNETLKVLRIPNAENCSEFNILNIPL